MKIIKCKTVHIRKGFIAKRLVDIEKNISERICIGVAISKKSGA